MLRIVDEGQAGPDRRNDPLLWFAELVLSDERGRWQRALAAQAELDRLGWQVKRKAAPKPRQADAGEGGGR
jgi:hypothetical protein